MQTFLPYFDFQKCALILDDKRLFKQLIEARQILASLGVPIFKNNGEEYSSRWENHPAVKMWKGYDKALCVYHDFIQREVIKRGFQTPIQPIFDRDPESLFEGLTKDDIPWWLGDYDFHEAHQGNLYRKDPESYFMFAGVGYIEGYWWPDNKTKTFFGDPTYKNSDSFDFDNASRNNYCSFQ